MAERTLEQKNDAGLRSAMVRGENVDFVLDSMAGEKIKEIVG